MVFSGGIERETLTENGLMKYVDGSNLPIVSDINPLSANPTKWTNTLKQFVGCCPRIVWVCLTILWDWRLKSQNRSDVLLFNISDAFSEPYQTSKEERIAWKLKD